MTLPFLLSTFQSGIVNLQIHSEPKVSSQLLLIFFSAEIGSVRQHGENDPYKLMCSRKNSLFK
jgi:hypothetical protein